MMGTFFWMSAWFWIAVVVAAASIGFVILFRSFGRWTSPAPRTPEQIQADMDLDSHRR